MNLRYIHRRNLDRFIAEQLEDHKEIGFKSHPDDLFLVDHDDFFDLYCLDIKFEKKMIVVTRKVVVLTESEHIYLENNGDKIVYEFKSDIPRYAIFFQSQESYMDILNHFGPKKFTNVLNKLNEYVYLVKNKPSSNYFNFLNTEGFIKEANRKNIKYMIDSGYDALVDEFILGERVESRSREINVRKKLKGSGVLEFNYHYNQEAIFDCRILSLVGKNGVGKTQALKSIKLSEVKASQFRKILAFDLYRSHSGRSEEFKSLNRLGRHVNFTAGIVNLFKNTREYDFFNTVEILNRVIKDCLNLDDVQLPVKMNRDPFSRTGYVHFLDLNHESLDYIDFSLEPLFMKGEESLILSTGQNAILSFVIQLLLHIKQDSLVLIDEPENTLHPNFVVMFNSVLNDILRSTDSYAVVSTHSIFYIRELPKESVMILSSNEDGEVHCNMSRLETFGASLDDLSDLVFFDDDVENSSDKYAQQVSSNSREEMYDLVKSLPTELAIKVLSND